MNTDSGLISSFTEDQYKAMQQGLTPKVVPIDPENLSAANRALLELHGEVQISRNSPCPCGSHKRFKRCCMTVADVIGTESVTLP